MVNKIKQLKVLFNELARDTATTNPDFSAFTEKAVDPKTGLPIKLDRLTWMGELDNYKDFSSIGLDEVQGYQDQYGNNHSLIDNIDILLKEWKPQPRFNLIKVDDSTLSNNYNSNQARNRFKKNIN